MSDFSKAPSFEATFGGGEANVAVALANYGLDAAFVTILPDNDIGEACLGELRRFGVDTESHSSWMETALGFIFWRQGPINVPLKSSMTGLTPPYLLAQAIDRRH